MLDLVYRKISKSGYPSLPRLLVNRSITDKYQIVKLGNSHADVGITFEGFNLRSLDLAGVAQRFSYDLVLLKQYHKQIEDNAVILIAVTPISFSHRQADRNDGMQYNYYDSVSPFLIPDLIIDDYIQQKLLPFLRSGYLLRKFYADLVKERIAKEEKWEEPKIIETEATTENDNQPKLPILNIRPEEILFNVEAIKAELTSPSPVDSAQYIDNMNFIFNKWYQTDEFDPKYFEINRRDLAELISYCRKNHWRPVLITIPVTEILKDGVLDDYMDKYLYENLEKVDLLGAEYIDFSSRKELSTATSFFGNADHLNSKGAAIFSYVLLHELIDKGYLAPDADGYDYRPLYKK